MIEERVELGQLKLDDGDGGVDLGLSVIEGLVEAHRRHLKSSNALLALLSRQGELSEVRGDGGILGGESRMEILLHLLHEVLEHQLHVRLHGTKLLLATGEVVVLFQRGRNT
jgi:hypothetical protein